MKKYLAAVSATALISIAPYALAASSTDLTVTGTITPSACTPRLSNNGEIDVGKTSVQDLNQTQSTPLDGHPMQLTVDCDAPTTYTLSQTDNNPGTTAAAGWFGIGRTAAGEKLGFFFAQITSTLADSQVAQAIYSEDNGSTWERSRYLEPDYPVSVGSATDHSAQIPVKNLVMDMQIDTFIARADSLTLTDETPINGSVTIEVKY